MQHRLIRAKALAHFEEIGIEVDLNRTDSLPDTQISYPNLSGHQPLEPANVVAD